MTWIVQISICILIVYGVIASETRKHKLLFAGALLLYACSQYVVYVHPPLLHRVFPIASYQNGQIIAAAQYYGFSLYRDSIVLYLPLFMLLGLFMILRVIKRADTHHRIIAEKPSPSSIQNKTIPRFHIFWDSFLSTILWFHIILFLWTITQRPETRLTPQFFIVTIILSFALTSLGHIAVHKKIRINPTNIQISLGVSTFINWILYLGIGLSGTFIHCSILAFTILFLYFSGRLNKKNYFGISVESLKQTWIIVLNGLIWLFPLCSDHITQVNTNFDAQNYATWFYAATKGYIPNQDIFYLYGFVTYLQNSNAIMKFMLMLYIIALLLLLFHLIKKITSSTIIASFVYLCMIFFTYWCGYWPLYRFLSPCIAVGWTAYVLSVQKQKTAVIPLVAGALCGILFFLFNDIGIISFVAISIILFIDGTVPREGKISSWKTTIAQSVLSLLYLIGGVCIGAAPFVIVLAFRGSLTPFFDFFFITAHISVYGKFLYFIDGWMKQDIPISLVIWTACVSILYAYLFQIRTFRSTRVYVTLGWTIVLLIVQWKNTIRPVGTDIQSVVFLVLCALLIHLQELVKNDRIRRTIVSIGMCAVLIAYFPDVFSQPNIQERTKALYYLYEENWILIKSDFPILSNIQRNIDTDVKNLSIPIDHEYNETVSWIRAQPDFTGMVYSYPGDPIFYLLFHQMPAPFFNAYDASSKPAQIKNIAFIEKNNIRYVIYNQDCTIEDIPIHLRTAFMSTYILKHFTPVTTIGKFMILKKIDVQSDIFDTDILNANKPLITDLLDLQMENIPKSEGRRFDVQSHHILTSGSLHDINYFLTNHPTVSNRIVLRITSPTQDSDQIILRINADQNKQTTIRFNSCIQPDSCLIHFERLPLFYTDRVLQSIESVTSVPTTHYQLIQLLHEKNIW